MHDSNREYILAGTQQSPELSLALNQVSDRQCFGTIPSASFSGAITSFPSSSSSSSSSRSRYAANSWRTVFSRLINSSIRWSQSQLLINCEVERHPSIRVRWVSLFILVCIVCLGTGYSSCTCMSRNMYYMYMYLHELGDIHIHVFIYSCPLFVMESIDLYYLVVVITTTSQCILINIIKKSVTFILSTFPMDVWITDPSWYIMYMMIDIQLYFMS